MKPLSIITINLNNLEGLKKTMESVFAQTFTDYEYIIIDGGSTDGSKEYIEQYAEKLTFWMSEKDAGIYEAMNKGIDHSKGEYLMFLNSGDYIINEKMIEDCLKIESGSQIDIYYGNMKVIVNGTLRLKRHPEQLTIDYLENNTINHQAAFIKRKLFHQLGNYDIQFGIAADHAFFLKALLKGKRFVHLNYEMVYYDLTGVSSARWKMYDEEMRRIADVIIPKNYLRIKNENNFYKGLMKQRIMKYAFKINKVYQGFRKSLKSK